LYHLSLRCYVVVELKAGEFKPEHLGKLGFYLTAVDEQVRHAHDEPTVGLLLCKSKNKIVAEYALRDNAQPLGVAEYELQAALPEQLQTSMPTIEQIEHELQERANEEDRRSHRRTLPEWCGVTYARSSATYQERQRLQEFWAWRCAGLRHRRRYDTCGYRGVFWAVGAHTPEGISRQIVFR